MPLRRHDGVAWVAWRQHRTALLGVLILLGAFALPMAVSGLRLHAMER